jgi:hypothetical protein
MVLAAVAEPLMRLLIKCNFRLVSRREISRDRLYYCDSDSPRLNRSRHLHRPVEPLRKLLLRLVGLEKRPFLIIAAQPTDTRGSPQRKRANTSSGLNPGQVLAMQRFPVLYRIQVKSNPIPIGVLVCQLFASLEARAAEYVDTVEIRDPFKRNDGLNTQGLRRKFCSNCSPGVSGNLGI